MRLFSSGAEFANRNQYFKAYCFSTDLVGHLVYIMGSMVGDFYQVTKTDITNSSKIPSIGLIVHKDVATECVVQTAGIVRDLLTGLTPNATLFVGDDSSPVEAVPSRPVTGYKYIQIVGRSLSDKSFNLSIESPTKLVSY